MKLGTFLMHCTSASWARGHYIDYDDDYDGGGDDDEYKLPQD